VETHTLPGPLTIDLTFKRITQEHTDEYSHFKHTNTCDLRIDRHAFDDVGDDQEYQPELTRSPRLQKRIDDGAIMQMDEGIKVPCEREGGTNHENGKPCQLEYCAFQHSCALTLLSCLQEDCDVPVVF
jgi:hypothetical protein